MMRPVHGMGPMISSAMGPRSAQGIVFSKGRDFAAWLGIAFQRRYRPATVPFLARYPGRGANRDLRVCSLQAGVGRAGQAEDWERHGLKPWTRRKGDKAPIHTVGWRLALGQTNSPACLERSWHRGRAFEARKDDRRENNPLDPYPRPTAKEPGKEEARDGRSKMMALVTARVCGGGM